MQEDSQVQDDFLSNYVVIPSKYAEMVKSVFKSDSRDLWNELDSLNNQLQDQNYLNVISALEQEQPLFALSRQIFFAEAIEKLTGQFVSKKMIQYRGFLLNWEKVFAIFRLLVTISNLFSISKLSKTANQGFTSVQNTFEDLWGSQLPIEVMRPGIALKQIDHTSIFNVIKAINIQRKLAKTTMSLIENSKILKNALHTIEFLSNTELTSCGLSGPIARASGVITPIIDLPHSKVQRSSYFFTQFAYGKSPSPLRIMEICSRELILALERMVYLYPKFQGRVKESKSLPENSGQLSASFPTTFGVNHITINLKDENVKYVNFIPFEFGNINGISKIIDMNSVALTPYFLAFLNPVIRFE